MLTKIGHADFEPNQRVLVTSDIHGHCDQLRQLLEKACYVPEKDILVIVGDMLEKGWQNLETLRFIMRLSETGKVYTLIGNADTTLYNLLTTENAEERRRLAERINSGKRYWSWTAWDEVCSEIGIPYAPDMDYEAAVACARERLQKEVAFLGNALTILDTPERIFVHASLPHERLDELEGTDNWPLIKTDDFYGSAPTFSRWVVTGHWPVPLMRETLQSANPVVDEKRKLICLDGGCGVKRIGQLNMMILQGGERSFMFCDSHRRFRALEDQAGSKEEPVYIKWTTRFIQGAEPMGDVTRIRYHGKMLTVPSVFVSENPWDGMICDDVTDRRLSVRSGEILYCVEPTSQGLFCKQDGVCGWYDGPYEWIDPPVLSKGGMIQ